MSPEELHQKIKDQYIDIYRFDTLKPLHIHEIQDQVTAMADNLLKYTKLVEESPHKFIQREIETLLEITNHHIRQTEDLNWVECTSTLEVVSEILFNLIDNESLSDI